MVGRVYNVHFHAMKPGPVIPFIRWLAFRDMLKIRILESLIPYNVPFKSPHPDPHLAVGPIGGSIDWENVAGSLFCRDVTFPKISKNQSWSYRAAM